MSAQSLVDFLHLGSGYTLLVAGLRYEVLMFRFLKSRIEVTLVDARTGQRIAQTQIGAGELPNAFLANRIVELLDRRWLVVEADPGFRRLIAAKGKLTLRVREADKTAPDHILYVAPSIAGDNPDRMGSKASPGDARLRADDWRQIECVSRAHLNDAMLEIRDIRKIRTNSAVGDFFRKIHLRARIPHPLAAADLKMLDVESYFGPARRAWCYEADGLCQPGAFSFDLGGGWFLYGLQMENVVSFMGLHAGRHEISPPITVMFDKLSDICGTFDLVLIDWCRCILAEPGSVAFSAVFTRPDL